MSLEKESLTLYFLIYFIQFRDNLIRCNNIIYKVNVSDALLILYVSNVLLIL